VHVRRLRGKVEEEPGAPVLLRTVRGVGYCWDPEPWPADRGADISNP
jgi:DNA-binding response OmpR family regulator